MTTLSIQLTTTLVASGRCVGMLPISVANFSTDREMLKTLAVKLPGTHVPTNVVTVKGRTLSPVAAQFIACAREVAKGMAGEGASHDVGGAPLS